MHTLVRSSKEMLAKEGLRRSYRPGHVRLLFVGEAPPASGRFFYQADSGLYRVVRHTFIEALPSLQDADFLTSFRDLGCYLVDLCGRPVDQLDRKERRQACIEGEARLGKLVTQLRPEIMITIVRSIAANVIRAQQRAGWTGKHLVLPYPGRWHSHRDAFAAELVPLLRKTLKREAALLKIAGR